MEYLSLSFRISPSEPFNDLVTFRLGEAGFEMFEDIPGGIRAFIQTNQFHEENLKSLLDECEALHCSISVEREVIPWKNWNEEWEKNFQPEIISNRVYVRAGFHEPAPSYPIELIVEPRMAFGTGHHPTTRQVMEQMLLMDLKDKTVLDMGCGTGILAILASKLGAASITAVDNDPNCISSTVENCQENNVNNVRAIEGGADVIAGAYDFVLANINRNIILRDLPFYEKALNSPGHLLSSGYYLDDLADIQKAMEDAGLSYLQHSEQQNWCCALFYKK